MVHKVSMGAITKMKKSYALLVPSDWQRNVIFNNQTCQPPVQGLLCRFKAEYSKNINTIQGASRNCRNCRVTCNKQRPQTSGWNQDKLTCCRHYSITQCGAVVYLLNKRLLYQIVKALNWQAIVRYCTYGVINLSIDNPNGYQKSPTKRGGYKT